MFKKLRGLFLCLCFTLAGCASEPEPEIQEIEIPAFTGDAVLPLGAPDFMDDDASTTAARHFSSQDSLGRTQQAMAVLGPELMADASLPDLSQIQPTGWKQKSSSLIDKGRLYERKALIAQALTGDGANRDNLITATHWMSTQGMKPYEDQVLEYIKDTDNHVLYRVTPVYDGDNLLASGVILEAWSVEDNGKGINFKVYCFNEQPGIAIDHATGDSSEIDLADDGEGAADYILDVSAGTFTVPWCGQVDEDVSRTVHSTIEKLEAAGFTANTACI